MTAGTVRRGDEVVVLPAGRRSVVSAIDTADGTIDVASAGDSVTLLLADDIDLSRGDLISGTADAPDPVTEFSATVTQLADKGLRPGMRALLRYGTATYRVIVSQLDYLLDIDTLAELDPPNALSLNDIAQVTLRTVEPVPVEAFRAGGAVGSLLIIDPADGTTLAAGMVGNRRSALHLEHFVQPPLPRPMPKIDVDPEPSFFPLVVPPIRARQPYRPTASRPLVRNRPDRKVLP